LLTYGWVRRSGFEAFCKGTVRFHDPVQPPGPISPLPVCLKSYGPGHRLQAYVLTERKVERTILLGIGKKLTQTATVRSEMARDFFRRADSNTKWGEDG
jgi:hypothetical protein